MKHLILFLALISIPAQASFITPVSSGGGSAVWGDIGGTLSDQGDLETALTAKLSLLGGTMTGDLSLGGHEIHRVSLLSNVSGGFSLISIGDGLTGNSILNIAPQTGSNAIILAGGAPWLKFDGAGVSTIEAGDASVMVLGNGKVIWGNDASAVAPHQIFAPDGYADIGSADGGTTLRRPGNFYLARDIHLGGAIFNPLAKQPADVVIAGTSSVSGTAVTGTSTVYLTAARVGDRISFPGNDGTHRVITAIADDTHLTIATSPGTITNNANTTVTRADFIASSSGGGNDDLVIDGTGAIRLGPPGSYNESTSNQIVLVGNTEGNHYFLLQGTENAYSYEGLAFFGGANGYASKWSGGGKSVSMDGTGMTLVAGVDLNSAAAVSNGVQSSAPATGASVTISDHISSLRIKPAGTIATLTVVMPANPIDGHIVHIYSTQIVTTLTMSPNSGQTLVGALASFTANGFGTWQYVTADTTWYRIG